MESTWQAKSLCSDPVPSEHPRGARKIDLEEKREHAPNPMIQEPFFSLPVVPAPTIPEVAVQAPVITPPMTTMGEDPEPVRQEPTEPIVEHERGCNSHL